ncbi:hypothetical protein [Neodiprion sertifer nucleopolyhedrovirus]|uniref:Per os infectivity factor 6 n=2 Tax=Baculoviridae TaxID=10442 RepID=Q6JKB9_9CBAC|nr:hypothetical protein NeseNPV_gp41 [Neodiprion sertifer nucleopolyhedrovirus]AAQ96418.1 hypothetical protein [Neodiprion sertifer nucleopolyhedrovirus]
MSTKITTPELVLQDANLKYYSTSLVVVDPDDRELAWKRLFMLLVNTSPHQLYRTHLSTGLITNFDYKQPLYVNLNNKQILSDDDSVNAALYDFYNRNTPVTTLPISSQKILVVGILLLIFSMLLSVLNDGYFSNRINASNNIYRQSP